MEAIRLEYLGAAYGAAFAFFVCFLVGVAFVAFAAFRK